MKIGEGGDFGPVHELHIRLADSNGEESPKAFIKQSDENVLFVPFHGSVDCCHQFANHHHYRAFVGFDDDWIVIVIEWKSLFVRGSSRAR